MGCGCGGQVKPKVQNTAAPKGNGGVNLAKLIEQQKQNRIINSLINPKFQNQKKAS